MKSLVDISINPPPIEPSTEPLIESLTNDSELEFTEQEQDGFYIVRAILSSIINPERVTHKDTLNWCNVLLDENSWRQIVRFHFNNSKKMKLEIYCLLYTSPSPRDLSTSRMPSSA